MDKEICFVAQFPPPIHGLSKAVDTLYNSYLNKKYKFINVNITNNKSFLINLVHLIKSKSDLYYITISQTKFGNIRDLIIIFLLIIKRKKIIVHLHGGYYRQMLEDDCGIFTRKLNKKLFKKLSAAITLGESLKYIFKGFVKENNIFVVENCVDNKYLIDEIEFENKIKIVEKINNLHILYLSNFIESKGYKEVLQVAKIINNNGIKRFKFIFAGKFYDKESLVEFNEIIEENDLGNVVEYKGIVTGDEKRRLLREADIFILLTRYKKEGQPISIIEAMGNGMSIITTDFAGITDLVKPFENGFFVRYNDYESIINLLNMLYYNRNIHLKIIKNNRNKVLNKFMEKHYIANIGNIFSEVLKNYG